MEEQDIIKEIEELTPQEDSETIQIIILDMIETISDDIKTDKLLKLMSKKSEVEISIIKRIYAKELNKTKKIQFEPAAKKIIQIYSNKLTLAEEFHKVQPYFYDKTRILWLWNNTRNCYEEIDETDLLNEISKLTNENTIDSKDKGEILEAMRQIGRAKVPKESNLKYIQFKNKLIEIQPPNTFYNKETIFIEKEVTPEYFITNPIPYNLSDSDKTPQMDKIFTEWVGEEYTQVLYEILAYCIYPDYPLNRIFFLIGSGSNGKSTFLKILSKFLGKQNLCSTELEFLVKNRFETSKLYKKLACIMGETNFNQLTNTSLLKRLCSGTDLIGFEKKNKNSFDDYNYAKIIIASNSLPETTDKTDGFYRRWNIIEFNKKFTEKIDILNTIPEEEYYNLTRKSLNNLKKLLDTRKFEKEGDIEDRRQKYEEKSNPLEKFLKEKTIHDPDCFIFKYEFTGVFKGWLRANGFREWNDTEIGRKMKERGFEEQRKIRDDSGNYVWTWLNLRWKSSSDSEQESKKNIINSQPKYEKVEEVFESIKNEEIIDF